MTNNKLQEMKKVADEKLQAEKEKLRSDKVAVSEKFPSHLEQALEALKKDLSAYDPHFALALFAQVDAVARRKDDDFEDVMKLAFARSLLKTVTSGDPMEMLLVSQMIPVHNATMENCGASRQCKNSARNRKLHKQPQ